VLVDAVIERLKTLGASRVASLPGIQEDVVFSLPRSLASQPK
jgi:hypothetical protein